VYIDIHVLKIVDQVNAHVLYMLLKLSDAHVFI